MAQEQLIRSFYDAVNSRDLDKFTSFFADDGQFKDVSSGHVYRGKSEIRGMAENWLKGVPDMKLQVSNVIGSGDSYSAEISVMGTHSGPLATPQGDLPPSGKKLDVPSCDVIRLKNGKIQSMNCYLALTVLLDQIGAMPSRKAA